MDEHVKLLDGQIMQLMARDKLSEAGVKALCDKARGGGGAHAAPVPALSFFASLAGELSLTLARGARRRRRFSQPSPTCRTCACR